MEPNIFNIVIIGPKVNSRSKYRTFGNPVSKIEVLIPTKSISNLKTVLNINASYSVSNYPTHKKYSPALFPPFLLLADANLKNSKYRFIFIYMYVIIWGKPSS